MTPITQEPTLADVSKKIDTINTTLQEVIGVVKMIYADTQVLKKDVAILKTDVAVLKTDVSVLKVQVTNLEEGQKKLELGQKNLELGQEKIHKTLQEHTGKLIRLETFQEGYDDRFNDLKYEVRKDSEKLDKVYDERKLVIHKFGFLWGFASISIAFVSIGAAKIFLF